MAKTTKPNLTEKMSAQELQPASGEKSFFARLSMVDMLYGVILLLVFAGVYSYIFDSKIHLGGDNAEYYTLGKSIAEGHGYSSISNAPTAEGFPAQNHFPPGYPFILAVIMKFFTTDLPSMTFFNGLFLLASTSILFFLWKKLSENSHLAAAACLMALFNVHIMEYSTIMMSEIPFLFFSALTLMGFVKSGEGNPLKDKYFWLTLLSVVASFYIRTAGLALVGGILLYLLLKRRWSYFGAMAIGFFLLVLPWQIRSSNLGGSSYMRQLVAYNPYYADDLGSLGTALYDSTGKILERKIENAPKVAKREFSTGQLVSDIAGRIGKNAARYTAREIPNGCLPFTEGSDPNLPFTTKEWMIGLLTISLILWGWWRLKNHRLLVGCYMLGAFGILLLWPDVWFGSRFELPLIPFFLFFFCNGLYEILKFILSKIGIDEKGFFAGVILPFTALLVTPKLFNATRYNEKYQVEEPAPCLQNLNYSASSEYEDKYDKYFKIAEYCKNNIPKDAVVCCRKPGLFYMYSDRYVTSFKKTMDKAALIQDLKDRRVNYVVIDQLGYKDVGVYLIPAVQAYPQLFPVAQQLETVLPEAPKNKFYTYLLKFTPEIGIDSTATTQPPK